MLGLAAIAAVASLAFIAGSASADSVCEIDKGHAKECSEPLALGTFLKGLTVAGKPATLGEVECHSTALGTVGKNEGSYKGLVGLIESLTFTGCKGGGCEEVTVTAENLPYKILGAALKLDARVSSDGNGKPAVKLRCIQISIFGVPILESSCLSEIEEASMLLDIEEDKLIAREEAMGGTCGFLWFDATYLLTLDGEKAQPTVYITALP